MRRKTVIGVLCVAVTTTAIGMAFGRSTSEGDGPSKKLLMLWTSGDRDVAIQMGFMYVRAAKERQWWDDVIVLVWGPSAQLLAQDEELQRMAKAMQKVGIKLQACIVCTNSYGVTSKLRELGVDVKPMGKPLTEMLQSGWTLLIL